MLPHISEVIRPRTLEEALEILVTADGSVVPVAGGTAKSLFKSSKIKALLDLWTLPLRYLQDGGSSLRIGATATAGDIVRSATVRETVGDALWEAASRTAASPLRNLITVGGNLASLFPWSDMPVALLVLDAKIHVRSQDMAFWAITDFIRERPRKLLSSRGLIAEIEVPVTPECSGSAFLKFAESRYAYAWVDAAAYIRLNQNICAECRIAVGAVESAPRRLPEVERLLTGQSLTADIIHQAGVAVLSAVNPIADVRSSKEYRLELTSELCQRVITMARDRAQLSKEVVQ